jgi:hypothetical protein
MLPAVRILDIAGVALGVCLLGVVLLGLAVPGGGNRPWSLVLGDGEFVVPPHWWPRLVRLAPLLVWLLIYGVFLTNYLGRPVVYDGVLRTASLVLMSAAAATCAAVIVGLAISWRRPPLTLVPAGVRIGRRTIAWDDIAADTRFAARKLPITGPSQPSLAANADLGSDPAFVGAAIGFYVGHPEARPAIGRDEEMRRLVEALATH